MIDVERVDDKGCVQSRAAPAKNATAPTPPDLRILARDELRRHEVMPVA